MKATIQKTYLQENRFKKSKTTLYGSILLLISAFLPCIDVVLKFVFPSMKDMKDSAGVFVTVDIWLTTLYLSPAILILATTLKPHPKLYFFPLFTFFYTAFVYFAPLLGFQIDFLRFNSWMAIIAAIISAILYMMLLKYIRFHTLEENSNDDMLKDMKEEYDKLRKENQELKLKLNTQIKN